MCKKDNIHLEVINRTNAPMKDVKMPIMTNKVNKVFLVFIEYFFKFLRSNS